MRVPITILEEALAKQAGVGSFAKNWWGNVSGKNLRAARDDMYAPSDKFNNTAKRWLGVADIYDKSRIEHDAIERELENIKKRVPSSWSHDLSGVSGWDELTGRLGKAKRNRDRASDLLNGKLTEKTIEATDGVINSLKNIGQARSNTIRDRLLTAAVAAGAAGAGAGTYFALRNRRKRQQELQNSQPDIGKAAGFTSDWLSKKYKEYPFEFLSRAYSRGYKTNNASGSQPRGLNSGKLSRLMVR